jgi:hypothetical protein
MDKKEINKEYYEKFKAKNHDKITNKTTCDQCGGAYVYYSKSAHLKTKKHLFSVKLISLYSINANII